MLCRSARSTMLAAATLLAVAGGSTTASQAGLAGAALLPEAEAKLSGAAMRDIVAESRLYCLALAVFFEGGSTVESEEGQRHIARVVFERAKANRRIWGGSDICDVVFYMRAGVCQFSFACLPAARRTPRGGPAWRYSVTVAKDELAQRSDVQERLIRYYMNPALTSDRNACRFRKEFVPVLQAGRHEFFREPTAAERAELKASEPIECKRYAEALEAAKKRAAEAAAKKRLEAKKRLAKSLAKGKKPAVAAKSAGKKVKFARQ
jgi:Cell Wall Hydrolase